MYLMHMSFFIYQRQTIQSYCAEMRTNTRRTFQGGVKCIPPFLLMSVDIFARRGILTECSQLPDYVQFSHERWVFFLVKLSLSSFELLQSTIKIKKNFWELFEYFIFTKQVPSFWIDILEWRALHRGCFGEWSMASLWWAVGEEFQRAGTEKMYREAVHSKWLPPLSLCIHFRKDFALKSGLYSLICCKCRMTVTKGRKIPTEKPWPSRLGVGREANHFTP